MNAWYNNKAVGRDRKTKGLERQQIVSWKLNNALNKTLEDSKSKIEELIKKSSRRQKKLQAKYSKEYQDDIKAKALI